MEDNIEAESKLECCGMLSGMLWSVEWNVVVWSVEWEWNVVVWNGSGVWNRSVMWNGSGVMESVLIPCYFLYNVVTLDCMDYISPRKTTSSSFICSTN